MSVSWLRILGLMVVSASLAAGCSSASKIEVGGNCIMNSDCNQPLVCTTGKCHDACHTSADCSAGQCVKIDNATVCQLPAEADCSKTQSCSDGFLCASDQRCRAICQSPSDCTGAQACMSGTCHDACQVSADCPIGQSCVKTGNASICQLPAEADCSTTLSCSGGLVCAVDLRCRAACLSRTDCTSEQICVGGVCAAPSDLDPNGQLPQRGPSLVADGGTDVRASDAGGQGADLAVGAPDVQSPTSADAADTGTRADASVDVPAPNLPDAGADLITGTPDTTITSSQTVALFHFDGTEGSTNLVDSSGLAHTAAVNGNPRITTSQSKFGGTSLYVNGVGSDHKNYVLVGSIGKEFTFAGDFTIDFWLYIVSYTNTWGSFVAVGNSIPTAMDFGGSCSEQAKQLVVTASWGSGGSNWCCLGTSPCAGPPLNSWHHVAITRSGSKTREFVDGQALAQAWDEPSMTPIAGGSHLLISGAPCEAAGAGDNGDFNGYIDELRVVNGVAVWTSNFTPPTAPYAATDVLPVDAGTPDLPASTPDSSDAVPADAAPDAPGVSCGGSGQPCCAASACTNGGCCVANTCVASGATCSTGGTCTAGTCAASATLSASPLSLDFGSVVVGQLGGAQSLTIKNTAQQTFGPITITSDSSDFKVQNGGCVSGTTTLAPNASCAVPVVFSPTLAGARTGTVTLSAIPGGSAGVSLSGTGVCPVDQPADGTGKCVPMAGVVWTQRGTQQDWISVASSSDGTKLVAVAHYNGAAELGGDIYTSADSGATWTPHGLSQYWTSVASSADGMKLVAVPYRGYIYTSGDSGATWAPHGGTLQSSWISVASSADGTKLVAVDTGGYIYTSVDSGSTWAQTGTQRSWMSVASSVDGTKLVAVVSGGNIYTSVDSGATWTQTATSQYWHTVASSVDGTKLVAVVSGGNIYTSVDSGATWTQTGLSNDWSSVASSSDGTKLVGVRRGSYIYTSTGPVP